MTEARERLSGGTVDSAAEFDRQRLQLFVDAWPTTFFALAAALVVGALFHEQDPTGTRWWIAVRILVSLVMIVGTRWSFRRAATDPSGTLAAFAAFAALGSVAWGLLPVLVRPAEPQWQAMLLFVLVGSLSVVTASYSVDRRVFVAAAAPVVLVGVVGLATFDGGFAVVLCLGLAFAAVYAVVVFVQGNRVMTAVFAAQLRNEQLVAELEQQRSDLREINERLHDMVDRQSMTLEERDALIAAVSHDLRSPLAAMSLMADTLAQRGDAMTDDQREAILARIAADARHAAEVLADLASTQRLRKQDVVATRSEIDLGALVESIVAARPSDRHDLTVGEIGLGAFPVVADRVLVGRILDNLVGNARKHTPDGARIVVSARRDGDEVLLFVDDDGPGLPEALRDSVFDAYVRGTSATTRPGSGVGLFLVRTFAQLHGGRAWWEPSPLGGSRFVVSLPQ